MDTRVRVKIAEYQVLRESGTLVTIGLGSCVGIACYDRVTKVAGLAHILLPDSRNFTNRENLAKFADTAVPLMLADMVRLGASIGRIQAKIAGGSELFHYTGIAGVGSRNIEAVKKVPAVARIPLLAADVGGTVGRTMQICVKRGYVSVKKVGHAENEL
jgi:chemotaxis protein CheD